MIFLSVVTAIRLLHSVTYPWAKIGRIVYGVHVGRIGLFADDAALSARYLSTRTEYQDTRQTAAGIWRRKQIWKQPTKGFYIL